MKDSGAVVATARHLGSTKEPSQALLRAHSQRFYYLCLTDEELRVEG